MIMQPHGRLVLSLWRGGRVIDGWEADNLVVGSAALAHSHLIGGAVGGYSVTQIGFGSNPAPQALNNSALSPDAFIKAVDSVAYPSSNQTAFSISLGAFEANGATIAEYGLLTANGTLYARLVRAAPIVKDITMHYTAVWTVTF